MTEQQWFHHITGKSCQRCGRGLTIGDWFGRKGIREPTLDGYPLCLHCWSVGRLLRVLQEHEAEFGTVEPCEPGLEIHVETNTAEDRDDDD